MEKQTSKHTGRNIALRRSKKKLYRNCPVQWLTSPSRLENSSNIKYPFKYAQGVWILILLFADVLCILMGKHLTTQHIPQSRKPMNENIFICTPWTSMEPGLLPSESFGSLQQGLSCLSSLQSCPPVACSVNTCSDFLPKKWTSSLEYKVLSRHRFTSLTCLRLSKG